ncbi:Beta-glucuronidase [Collinsella aerofaciens]|uniref:Beta-glucuronidase n=1 Tax=Collinsella aerofaciens TaxID=74426 RepID=A0A5K1J2I5_9ACTN|nr:beta-glucuronidase [Collinsella aerofaciens]VWL96555.1 Beta-glucuronidase [Collinsella aerofaciens]VWL99016.1 Beta-glucuronidase [Collinsella aerofaciens]
MSFDSMYPRTTSTRRIQSLDGTWDFTFDRQGVGETEKWQEVGLPNPVDMPVPASFSDIFTDKESREFCGDMWYARRVFIPGEWRNGNVDIRFDAATHRAVVYLNGIRLVEHEGGFTPFCAHANDAVRWNDWNLLVVKVNNELSHESLPLGRVKELKSGARINQPYFDFFNYSGLQRSVRLLYTPSERIVDMTVVTESVTDGTACVRYEIETDGEHEVRLFVRDADGATVVEAKGASGALEIENAHLWNIQAAYLYTFVAQIVNGDEVIDEYFDEIGLRTVAIEGRDFLVNGHPVYLKGFGRHEDSPIHGRGFDPVVARRDFELMKWMGCNSFRTSHYPYAEEELQEADREGFLVIDEVAAVGFLVSTQNFDDATKKSVAKTLFDLPGIEKTLEVHEQAVRELIDRDKNYACVCAWSLFNEPDFSTDGSVPYATQIFDLARELDPQKRPRSYTNVTRCRAGIDKCTHLADFMMLNRYDGWYVSPGPEIEDAREILVEEMHEWEELEPDKPFFFTEYGCDTMAGVHKLPSVMWSEEYQVEYFKMQHEVFDMFDWVVGEQPWNLCDFQTVEGKMRVDGNKKGAFTRDRQPKAVAFLLRDRWRAKSDYIDGFDPRSEL